MKILNVNMSVDPVTGGGTAERTVQISRALNERGLASAILCTDANVEHVQRGVMSGSEVIRLPVRRGRFFVPRVSHRTLLDMVAEFDVVHLMNHWTVLNALVYRCCRALKKPYVVCPAGALRVFGRSKLKKHLYNGLIGNRLIRHASAHVAVTRQESGQFAPYGVPADSVTVIPNGIRQQDFERFDSAAFRARHRLPDVPLILFVGRLNPIKGPDLLLDAFLMSNKVASACHLVLAGPDGGMLDQLKLRVASSRRGDRVHFVGFLGGDDRSSAYHAARLLVIPSRQEAMSLVALEAGICGTPVLLTDQCGFDEIATIGGGRVVPPDAGRLALALEDLLLGSEDLARQGANLEAYIRENYLWSIVVENYVRLFENIA